LARPIVTYVLLGALVLVFLFEVVASGFDVVNTTIMYSNSTPSQVNAWVSQGEYWRLVASLFLHFGILHLVINALMLWVIGREVEALYGSVRFVTIYFLSGLFGNVAFYCLGGPFVPSAGASGAVFGIIGAEIAFYYLNRRLLGGFSQQRLRTLSVLVAIFLVSGFTAAGINHVAHIGGLISGLLLGLALAPRYSVRWEGSGYTPAPRLVDDSSASLRILGPVIAILILLAGIRVGNQRWASASSLPSMTTPATQTRAEAPQPVSIPPFTPQAIRV
jgi:rhomboid protease GluP